MNSVKSQHRLSTATIDCNDNVPSRLDKAAGIAIAYL